MMCRDLRPAQLRWCRRGWASAAMVKERRTSPCEIALKKAAGSGGAELLHGGTNAWRLAVGAGGRREPQLSLGGVAGIAIPRSPAAGRGLRLRGDLVSLFSSNHCMRTFLIGALAMQRQKLSL